MRLKSFLQFKVCISVTLSSETSSQTMSLSMNMATQSLQTSVYQKRVFKITRWPAVSVAVSLTWPQKCWRKVATVNQWTGICLAFWSTRCLLGKLLTTATIKMSWSIISKTRHSNFLLSSQHQPNHFCPVCLTGTLISESVRDPVVLMISRSTSSSRELSGIRFTKSSTRYQDLTLGG